MPQVRQGIINHNENYLIFVGLEEVENPREQVTTCHSKELIRSDELSVNERCSLSCVMSYHKRVPFKVSFNRAFVSIVDKLTLVDQSPNSLWSLLERCHIKGPDWNFSPDVCSSRCDLFFSSGNSFALFRSRILEQPQDVVNQIWIYAKNINSPTKSWLMFSKTVLFRSYNIPHYWTKIKAAFFFS